MYFKNKKSHPFCFKLNAIWYNDVWNFYKLAVIFDFWFDYVGWYIDLEVDEERFR